MSQENSLIHQISAKLTKKDYDTLVSLTKNYSTSRSLIIREAIVAYLQNFAKQTQAAS